MISIIIPSYDSPKNKTLRERLKRDIKKITAPDVEYEIIEIIDKNGYAQAVNKGIRKAKPENDIAIVSDDVELNDPIWLNKFVSTINLYKDQKVGIVSAGLLRKKTFITKEDFEINLILTTIGFAVIRRDMINEIGYLDETFKYGAEEIDWIIRAAKRGWKVTNASIFHRHPYAKTMKNIKGIRDEFNKSHRYLLKKHNFKDDDWNYNDIDIEAPIYEQYTNTFTAQDIFKDINDLGLEIAKRKYLGDLDE